MVGYSCVRAYRPSSWVSSLLASSAVPSRAELAHTRPGAAMVSSRDRSAAKKAKAHVDTKKVVPVHDSSKPAPLIRRPEGYPKSIHLKQGGSGTRSRPEQLKEAHSVPVAENRVVALDEEDTRPRNESSGSGVISLDEEYEPIAPRRSPANASRQSPSRERTLKQLQIKAHSLSSDAAPVPSDREQTGKQLPDESIPPDFKMPPTLRPSSTRNSQVASHSNAHSAGTQSGESPKECIEVEEVAPREETLLRQREEAAARESCLSLLMRTSRQ